MNFYGVRKFNLRRDQIFKEKIAVKNFFSIFAILSMMSMVVGIVHADSTTLSPVVSSPQSAGESFTVDIQAQNVANLFGVSFELSYDTTYINATSVSYDSNLLGANLVIVDNIDDGIVGIGVSRKSGADGINGTGFVAHVTFTSDAQDESFSETVSFAIQNIYAVDDAGASIIMTEGSASITLEGAAGDGSETGITFTFANGQITGTTPKYYEFDVMAQANKSDTKIGDCLVYINYNTAGFGASIVASNNITVTKETLIQGEAYGSALYEIQNVADNTSSRVAITIEFVFGAPAAGNELPTTQTQLLHIKIEIANQSQTAGLSFQQSLMDGQQSESDNTTKYNPVVTSNTDESSLPVQLSSFTTLSSDKGVLVSWRTETEVGNVGFSIYRSEKKDGSYTKIASVGGAGNSAMPIDYQFVDKEVKIGKTYFYYIEDIDIVGERTKSEIIKIVVSSVPKEVVPPVKLVRPIPKEFRLLQNYPNPFNPETWIPYQLAFDAQVIMRIYNARGNLVRITNLGKRAAGVYISKHNAAYWDGKDNTGEHVSSGVYFYQLEAGKFSATRKMIIIK